MAISNGSIRNWLERHFTKDRCDDEPLRGTYGLIWFLNAKDKHTYPQSFAIKTVQPERLAEAKGSNDIEAIRREFRIWLDLPKCLNVVSAFGVEVATVENDETEHSVKLPIMRMERMQGSLDDWIQQPSKWDECDRLIALAQALNGLQWLYQNGIEGHGDLKPSNFLYDDLNKKVILDDAGNRWPSKRRGWVVKVSDLGWADAWRDYGLTDKAWRQYLAPERVGADGRFIPIKSDIFSMGIIACELLRGRHPCENLKVVVRSESKWKRWAQEGQKILDGIEDVELQNCIQRALSGNPEERPTALEFQDCVIRSLVERHDCNIRQVMEHYRQPTDELSRAEHLLWTTSHVAKLEEKQKSAAVQRLLTLYKSVDPKSSFDATEAWMNYAASLLEFGKSEPEAATLRASIEDDVRRLLVHALANVSKEQVSSARPIAGLPSLRPFERLSQLFSSGGALIGDSGTLGEGLECNPYALAAYHFAHAGKARMEGDWVKVNQELTKAIATLPSEATSYYFRALWLLMADFLKQRRSNATEAESSKIAVAAADLRKAIALEPDWPEPKKELENILRMTADHPKREPS